MDHVPHELAKSLREYGQEHVLDAWDQLSAKSRKQLVEHLDRLNLGELRDLYARRDEKINLPPMEAITPLPRPDDAPDHRAKFRPLGEAAFREGKVAFLVVAGGQGSRLGFEHPKGMFSIGPVTGKTLFQIHAEKVLAISRKFGQEIPLLVMTSSVTHDETVAFFEEKRNFGLPAKAVKFFQQGSMPALDLETGKLLMEDKDRLFLGPNGHGGTITGLAEHGLLAWLRTQGVETISYFQVDNPIVKLADYVFLGRHLDAKAEVSSKVVVKQFPTEKLGNLALIDGRCGIIEYSDLPEALAAATDDQGRPTFWAGNPAIHLFDVDFLQRMTADASAMPWHLARKKVPYMTPAGEWVEPTRENALKFERFIFDVLPRADRWTATTTTRAEEFEPVKNASGPESPATARQALVDLAGRWLEAHGVHVPRDDQGHVTTPIDISPLAALEAEDLAGRVSRSVQIAGPFLIEN
jgi:UDP-N-acetylglucosamine/UDP-N-acetylgalactosamine diphosphorylase